MGVRDRINSAKLNMRFLGLLPNKSTDYVLCENIPVISNTENGRGYYVAKPYEPSKDKNDPISVQFSDFGFYIEKVKQQKPDYKGLIFQNALLIHEDAIKKVMQAYADHYNLPIIGCIHGKDVSLVPSKTLNNTLTKNKTEQKQ